MNTKTTETPEPPETKPQESQAPRPWVTPAFERVPLNEALGPGGPGADGIFEAFS